MDQLKMKYTELETSYEHYKERTENEIMGLREKLRLQENLEVD